MTTRGDTVIYGYSVSVQQTDPEGVNKGKWRAVVIGDEGVEFKEGADPCVAFAYGETEREALHAAVDNIPFNSEVEETS